MTQDPRAETVTLTMTELEALVGKVAEQAAEKSVRKVLSEIGLFTADEDRRAEAQEDILWLRRWRRAVDAAAGTIGRTVIVVLLGAIIGAMWVGAQVQLLKPPHP